MSGNVGVAHVYWIQYRNADHRGQYPNGKPLTRLSNAAAVTANRNAMCSGFKLNTLVPKDSCDEFPFAATNKSGRLLGLTSAQCSQVRFQFANGNWTAYAYPGYSTTQRCSLGRVPLNYNESVGGSYSAFIQNNRVLNGDSFWIGVSN